MPAPTFRETLNTVGFASNPIGYMLMNGGQIPDAFGGGTIQGRVGGVASRVGSWIQGTFGGGQSSQQANTSSSRAPSSARPQIGNINSGNVNSLYRQNRNIAQAGGLSARNAINNRFASNRQTFRDLNAPLGAAHRNGNSGRLLGDGIIGAIWKQSGINFNDRQQVE